MTSTAAKTTRYSVDPCPFILTTEGATRQYFLNLPLCCRLHCSLMDTTTHELLLHYIFKASPSIPFVVVKKKKSTKGGRKKATHKTGVHSKAKKAKRVEKPKKAKRTVPKKPAKKKEKIMLSKELLEAKRRLESFKKLIESKPSKEVARAKTYVPGFDDLTYGGLVEGSNVVFSGGPGTGKTLFCLEYCYRGAQQGDNTLFISTNEPITRLRAHAKFMGWDTEKEKNMNFLFYSPYEMKEIIRSDGMSLQDFVEENSISKVAVDSLTSIAISFVSKQEENDFIYNFFEVFNRLPVSTIFTLEKGDGKDYSRWEFMADGIVKLHYYAKEDLRVRGMEVIKMRDTPHVEKVVPYMITSQGVKVFPHSSVFI
ncbi:MAG: hypothetical protein D6769_02275 [Methanobacteriota archaeon]|nr:MAG: hypothetical protein D6769_02275 [Euryarchaeota archaeon]